MKPFILLGFSVLLIALFISAVAFISIKNEMPAKHVEVVLRNLGHELLLTAKDSSSRVLPIKQLNETTYQVSFQHPIGFVSDSLINLIQRSFQKNGFAKDYIVNLRKCEQNETVFAFEINNQQGDLTPCRGRTLEVDCYLIEIELLKKSNWNPHLLWLFMIPLGLAGYYMSQQFRKKEGQEPISDETEFIPLGSFRFYAANLLLKSENTSIDLSEKETKALKIFAAHINETVEREQLMKAIWEEEGVVVISRNVDVLVSKLRKKLSDDPSIKLVNVHGRGYKFMIE